MRFAFLPILGQILLVQRHILPILNKLVRSAGTKPTSALLRRRLPDSRKPAHKHAGPESAMAGATDGWRGERSTLPGRRASGVPSQPPAARTSRCRVHRRRHPLASARRRGLIIGAGLVRSRVASCSLARTVYTRDVD